MSQTVAPEAPVSSSSEDRPDAPTVAPVRTRRSVIGLAAAIALVITGAVVFAVLLNASSRTDDVVIVSDSIERGDTIGDGDLSTLAIGEGQTTKGIPAAELDSLIGKVAAVDLPAGSLVTSGSVTDALGAPEGRAIVGVSLTSAQMPVEPLRAGEDVIFVPLTNQVQGAATQIPLEQTIPAVVSQVRAPAEDAAGTLSTTIDVYVAADLAPTLTAAAATGSIAVYVAPAAEEE